MQCLVIAIDSSADHQENYKQVHLAKSGLKKDPALKVEALSHDILRLTDEIAPDKIGAAE